MQILIDLIDQFNTLVWTYILPAILLFLGILMTIKLKGYPQRNMHTALKYLISSTKSKHGAGSISPLAALALALSATVGIGNIVGVLSAIQLGGPGALFWMWIVGIIGITLKYSETTLALKYRQVNHKGQYTGGPMYYLRDGVGSNLLAIIFALSAIAAILLGIATFPQVHSIIDIFTHTFETPLILTSLVLSLAVAAITLGGLKSTARIATIIMPFIITLFIGGSLFLILSRYQEVPAAFALIFKSAFSPTAAVSGGTGYAIKLAIEQGARRGIFSNESGLGSASIAAATAFNIRPAQQGLVHVLEVVIDTLIINTLVGLLVIMSGVYTQSGPEQVLLNLIFEDPTYIGQVTMTVSLVFFAFTSIVAWSYYGSQCAYFLWGEKGKKIFHYVFVVVIFIAGFVDWATIWTLSDLTTGILVFPNLIGLFLLRHEVLEETNKNRIH